MALAVETNWTIETEKLRCPRAGGSSYPLEPARSILPAQTPEESAGRHCPTKESVAVSRESFRVVRPDGAVYKPHKSNPKPDSVLRTIPCPECGNNVDLTVGMLAGFLASERVAARFFCPRCPAMKEAEQSKKQLDQFQEEERIWQEDRKAFLGHDCPALQAKLFWFLKDDDRQWEYDVCEYVYGHRPDNGPSGKRLRDRLRQLERRLNLRLIELRRRLSVERPEPGYLELVNSKPPGATPGQGPIPDSLRELLTSALGEMSSPQDWAEFFLKPQLSPGQWIEKTALWENAKRLGCTKPKFRKAEDLLGVERMPIRVGPGNRNRWYIRRVTGRASSE